MAANDAARVLPERFSTADRERALSFLVVLEGNVAAALRGVGADVARFTQALRHPSAVRRL